MQMEPVAGNINSSPHLEEQRPSRIEHGQDEAQTHGRAPIDQHVKHRSKLRA